jgi:imidazole glycerol phosphate synthase glutamine amidotransferase subunit
MGEMKVGIVDYGAGNLRSVMNALERLGAEYDLIQGRKDMEGIDRLILPGVGEYRSALECLRNKGLEGPIKAWLSEDRPFLGICLGMQILFATSEEAKGTTGLAFLDGEVLRFKKGRVPQIGWNQVTFKKGSILGRGLPKGPFFYFLHGYYVRPADDKVVTGRTEYGIRYASAVEKGNACAVQFHPEKSGDVGIGLLKNWIMAKEVR